MAVPTNQEKWSRSLRAERPWEINPISDELKAILHDDDLAEVIWALMREGAVKWLDTKLISLGGRTPRDHLSSDEKKAELWAVLEAASAWL
jgi:hypothetical protein